MTATMGENSSPVTPPPSTSTEAATPSGADDRPGSWVRWSGIGFGVLFLVGWITLTFTWDDNATDQEIIDWYGDSGNRVRQMVGAYLTALAGVAFVVFTTGLTQLIPKAGISRLVRSLSMVFSTLLIAATAAIANASASVEVPGFDEPQDAELLRLIEGIGFGMVLLGGTIAVGVAVILASYGLRGTRVLPAWLVVAGYVIGAVLALLGVLYIPLVLLVLWALAVGITVRPEPAAA